MTLHPQCRPKGNQFYGNGDKCEIGLFTELEDNALVLTMLSYWHPEDLLTFGQTCKHAYVWSWFDELWKFYCIRDDIHIYRGSWRASWTNKLHSAGLNCMVYNDLIFDLYRYANTDLPQPSQLNMPTVHTGIPLDEFLKYEINGIPCIIKDGCSQWNATKHWSFEYLSDVCGDTLFQAEQIDLTIKEFSTYALSSPRDEAPIYLFDKNFLSNVPELGDDFECPEYFIDDLFQYLPARPDFRWLIVGPARSGSTWHIDPNGTSAWNATIKGKKLWIMMPPNKSPPGIYPSADGATVTTPLSLMDWYVNYRDHCDCIEGISEEGDVVFIPSGWWHMVINLEASIAITQNYANRYNLRTVLKFLKCKTDQISGTEEENLYEKLLEVLDPIGIPKVQQILKEFKKKNTLNSAFMEQRSFAFKFGQ